MGDNEHTDPEARGSSPQTPGEKPSPPAKGTSTYRFLTIVACVFLVACIGLLYSSFLGPTQALLNDMSVGGRIFTSMPAGCYTFFRTMQVMGANVLALRFVLLTTGSLIVGLGALFILKGIEATYNLTAEVRDVKSSLVTSSPGLVMITLGIGAMISAVYHNQDFQLQAGGCLLTIPPADADADAGASDAAVPSHTDGGTPREDVQIPPAP